MMIDPIFLIVFLLMAPGFVLLVGVVVSLALTKKPKDQWPRIGASRLPIEPIMKQDADG